MYITSNNSLSIKATLIFPLILTCMVRAYFQVPLGAFYIQIWLRIIELPLAFILKLCVFCHLLFYWLTPFDASCLFFYHLGFFQILFKIIYTFRGFCLNSVPCQFFFLDTIAAQLEHHRLNVYFIFCFNTNALIKFWQRTNAFLHLFLT